jgi:lipid A 4'-phosphatase
MSLVLGPGLLVNSLLKEHSGRARPVQTTLFGGTQAFTPAWTPADQCSTNCAFVSGHAAVAAWPVAGAFLARRRGTRRAWLAGGLLAGLAVGLGRMATGSHFLSDVVIAVLLVYLVCAACAAWLLRPPASAAWPAVPRPPDSPAGAAPASRPAD